MTPRLCPRFAAHGLAGARLFLRAAASPGPRSDVQLGELACDARVSRRVRLACALAVEPIVAQALGVRLASSNVSTARASAFWSIPRSFGRDTVAIAQRVVKDAALWASHGQHDLARMRACLHAGMRFLRARERKR
jgi:hypothetical protein